MTYKNLARATTKVLLDIIQKDKIPSQIIEIAKLIEDISLKNKFLPRLFLKSSTKSLKVVEPA